MPSDNFNRVENPLASGWTTTTGHSALQADGANCDGTVNSGDHSSYWSAQTPSGDHWTEITWRGVAQDSGPCVRNQKTAATMYNYDAVSDVIAKIVAGAFTTLQSGPLATWANNDVGSSVIQGSTIKLKKNGVQVNTNLTDTAIAGGTWAIFVFSTAAGNAVDNFNGGDFAAGGAFPPVPEAAILKDRLNTLLRM